MNINNLEWIQMGGYPFWRAGFEARQGGGNPSWGQWEAYVPGTPHLLHGQGETERAARWLLPPLLPGEEESQAAFWTLRRWLDLPWRREDPALLPWEVVCLLQFLEMSQHRGRAESLMRGMGQRPIEGYDVRGVQYEYRGAGGRAAHWLMGPSTRPHLLVSLISVPPPSSSSLPPWSFLSSPPSRTSGEHSSSPGSSPGSGS